jgi:hypothetical protein
MNAPKSKLRANLCNPLVDFSGWIDAAQQIDPCSSRDNFHPMQSASVQVA